MEINLFEIFTWGVDYGQLLMEDERDNEDLYDAFQGSIVDRKYGAPAEIAQRRQPHSDKWRYAKKKSYMDFMNLLADTKGKTVEIK